MWTSDEFGNKTFTHDGWEIKAYPDGAVYITAPDTKWSVDITDSGIDVKGEMHSGYECCGVTVSIPFVILEEFMKIRSMT